MKAIGLMENEADKVCLLSLKQLSLIPLLIIIFSFKSIQEHIITQTEISMSAPGGMMSAMDEVS
jgi:hypothetical protein